ncbi:PhoD-like phosphatase [Antricoccus suffuscus]|uniref:PhoD-like phosphatase n=1 Tax=Antricoccus suffuscus TaxID=1629062 RepID=A0A2T0ZVN0_9ACTN|nr:alkaline phosphatase D family protein [Antricoccus suffuscus]PRZ40410.1 PhoD-like phosphatase [Antricoccus suffuscus]
MPDNAAQILVGPLLRYVDNDSATIWLETDRSCAVSVRCGDVTQTEPTWGLHGHHYALIVLRGLTPGTATEYTVELDEDKCWPLENARPSLIRTSLEGGGVRLAFGSCRRGEPDSPEAVKTVGADSLIAMARQMSTQPIEQWPDALLLLGDQVYADMPSAPIVERLKARRRAGLGPATVRRNDGEEDVSEEICDFEEYTWLYQESWTDEQVRWLLSTVPSCMILDDHDLRDDWNSSFDWRRNIENEPWWPDRVIGAFSSYWVYQHLGNLSPRELDHDVLLAQIRSAADDHAREEVIADFAWRADAEPGTARWSFHRDFGRTRLVMLDARASRNLTPGHRDIMDPDEWQWARAKCLEPGIDHLVIGSSVPVLMIPGLHHLEGWNEAAAEGRLGPLRAKAHERLRLWLDLEHWSAFRRSFNEMADLIAQVARPNGQQAPATILMLSGDVHCSFIEEAWLEGPPTGTRIHQLTMSPFRNPLELPIRVVNKIVKRPRVAAILRGFARRAGVQDPGILWDVTGGPWFDNGVMTVVVHDRHAAVEVDHAFVDRGGAQSLRHTARRDLSAPA